jgi:cobalt/nickel transport protein
MKSKYYVVLIIAVVVLFAAPLLIFPLAEFGGADSAAGDAIADSGYEPWFHSILVPPSGEIETLLFSLQAAIGSVIIGYFVGYERGKRAKKKEQKNIASTRDIETG